MWGEWVSQQHTQPDTDTHTHKWPSVLPHIYTHIQSHTHRRLKGGLERRTSAWTLSYQQARDGLQQETQKVKCMLVSVLVHKISHMILYTKSPVLSFTSDQNMTPCMYTGTFDLKQIIKKSKQMDQNNWTKCELCLLWKSFHSTEVCFLIGSLGEMKKHPRVHSLPKSHDIHREKEEKRTKDHMESVDERVRSQRHWQKMADVNIQ